MPRLLAHERPDAAMVLGRTHVGGPFREFVRDMPIRDDAPLDHVTKGPPNTERIAPDDGRRTPSTSTCLPRRVSLFHPLPTRSAVAPRCLPTAAVPVNSAVTAPPLPTH